MNPRDIVTLFGDNFFLLQMLVLSNTPRKLMITSQVKGTTIFLDCPLNLLGYHEGNYISLSLLPVQTTGNLPLIALNLRVNCH